MAAKIGRAGGVPPALRGPQPSSWNASVIDGRRGDRAAALARRLVAPVGHQVAARGVEEGAVGAADRLDGDDAAALVDGQARRSDGLLAHWRASTPDRAGFSSDAGRQQARPGVRPAPARVKAAEWIDASARPDRSEVGTERPGVDDRQPRLAASGMRLARDRRVDRRAAGFGSDGLGGRRLGSGRMKDDRSAGRRICRAGPSSRSSARRSRRHGRAMIASTHSGLEPRWATTGRLAA